EKAGLRTNDIVIAFGEHPVLTIDAMHKLLSDEHAATATPLAILRGTEKLVIEVTPEYRS
ncbi:MAG TPA: hypothetical protein VN867_13465, partial [Candidatus Binataceae bacterium]|nr:hypothetical protein [Candidatus Binataceae bacterium]